ncbi:MAG TPA: tRNA (adenosine(37)-N6)-dimethylallyltransferase MiaA [Ilumatobacteraceae bacterium]|nr:tRNA (adenosine(37)-N6)-dimethylallyltransferase MiaA [Ilumatobacteraceae bacterium]
MSNASIRPLVILGSTASGKSDVAMAYALARPGTEILAVDAMQVYRRMDIGTAKPSAADRAAVPHHGIDLAEPSDEFAVTDFELAARAALGNIDKRGGQPVLVAGTGLYLRALTDPMEIPGRWPDVRSALEARAADEGSAALHRQLVELDPLAASRMEPSNERRVVRALEVTIGSGRPFSSFGPGIDQYPRVDFDQVGLRWRREVLTVRIADRVHRMMTAGLLAEVERLVVEPLPLSRTARQALGYKELIAHLEGELSLDEAVASVIQRTRQFAVRQERWFRRDPRIRWVQIEHDPVAEVLAALHST